MYLGALVDEIRLPVLARDASDQYSDVLAENPDGRLKLFQRLLPGRHLEIDFKLIRSHEHRAGVVSVLSALSVAAGDYISVGNAKDGDIILPPKGLVGHEYRWADSVA